MEKCENCEWNYRDGLLSPLFIGHKGYTAPVCGICALELSNQEMGTKRNSFHGEIAEQMRQDAIHWRRTHNQDGKKK